MKHKTLILTLICLIAGLSTSAQTQKDVKARVMTFNIRQENNGDGCNNWEMRFLQVGQFLIKNKVDIIGMQEVKHTQLTDLKDMLTDYDCTGVARDNGKTKGEYNPIFYNKNKYKLLRSQTFWLSETPDTPSTSWGSACRRIATWAILQDIVTKKSIMVLNTHLDHISQQARLNGATLIKEKLGRMLNDLPIVVMGDLNIADDNLAYSKIANAIFPLNDVWKTTSPKKGKNYTFHDFGKISPQDAEKIDYIFTSSKIKVKKAVILDTAIDKEHFLSDHNAHYADIVF